MASLRTHLIDSLNPTKYPFFSLVTLLHPFIPQVNNTDDLNKDMKGKLIDECKTSSKARTSLNRKHSLRNQSFKNINRMISLNINNFSQLSDTNSNDFKDCQNFIHVLQLQQNDQNEFALSELDTINSMMISSDNAHHKMKKLPKNGGQRNHGLPTEMDQDFSEVEDL